MYASRGGPLTVCAVAASASPRAVEAATCAAPISTTPSSPLVIPASCRLAPSNDRAKASCWLGDRDLLHHPADLQAGRQVGCEPGGLLLCASGLLTGVDLDHGEKGGQNGDRAEQEGGQEIEARPVPEIGRGVGGDHAKTSTASAMTAAEISATIPAASNILR